MDGLGEYLLTVTVAAIVCSIAKHIAGDKGSAAKIVRLISGIFMTVTVLSPIVGFSFNKISYALEDYRVMASEASEAGQKMASKAMADIIKENTEAYILEEAKKMKLDIAVEVTLCDNEVPAPCQVIITGTVSPYQKTVLSQVLSNELGISRENQKWK